MGRDGASFLLRFLLNADITNLKLRVALPVLARARKKTKSASNGEKHIKRKKNTRIVHVISDRPPPAKTKTARVKTASPYEMLTGYVFSSTFQVQGEAVRFVYLLKAQDFKK